MRGRAWWNKAHYGNENTGCYNNLYRKAACTREGQCSITVIRDSNSVPQYEEEQQECWTFCCTVWRLIAPSQSKTLAADSQLRKPVPFPMKTQQASSAAPPRLDNTGAKIKSA